MGALNGSLSYTRFYVEGELPPDYRRRFVEAAQERAFIPLAPGDEDEERMGWCSIEHPLDLVFDEHKLFYNEYLNLALRIDRWRLPAALVKAFCTEAERKYLLENRKERLRKSEREEIKASIIADLKARLLPALQTIDVSWNTHSGIVRFWNQSARLCETFQDLFEETFKVRLIPDNPYVSALQCELDETQTERLADLEPVLFHRLDHATGADA